MSNRAAAVAVIVAFVVGLIGSLAVRPPGGGAGGASATSGGVALRVNWRVPVVFQTTLPVKSRKLTSVVSELFVSSIVTLSIAGFG